MGLFGNRTKPAPTVPGVDSGPGVQRPTKGETPWTEEEIQRGRVGWVTRYTSPIARLFAQKWSITGLILLLLFQQVRVWRMDSVVRNFVPLVIRINDVGKAEVVHLDTAWLPEEPEIRNQIQSLVVRMFARNGFTLPESIELNSAYLVGEAYKEWVRQAKEDLKLVAGLKSLRRVRILYLQIERVAQAKSPQGTRATVRFATDELTENGAVVANSAKGYEVSMDFRVGDWIQTEDDEVRKKWTTRNPLGLRLLRYQVQQYVGTDVPLQEGAQVVILPGNTADYAPGTAPDVNTAQDPQFAAQALPTRQPILPPAPRFGQSLTPPQVPAPALQPPVPPNTPRPVRVP